MLNQASFCRVLVTGSEYHTARFGQYTHLLEGSRLKFPASIVTLPALSFISAPGSWLAFERASPAFDEFPLPSRAGYDPFQLVPHRLCHFRP